MGIRPRPPLALRGAHAVLLGWVSIHGCIRGRGGTTLLMAHAEEFRPPPIAPSSSSSSFETNSNDAAEESRPPPIAPASSSSSSSSFEIASNFSNDAAAYDALTDDNDDVTSSVAGSRSSVSGCAFFDSHGDGVRDVATSAGIPDVAVGLRHCDANESRGWTTQTGRGGYYAFEGLRAGRYYVAVEPPRWYALSDAWDDGSSGGGADESSSAAGFGPPPSSSSRPPVGADVSAVDPATGRTACFDLEDGEGRTIGFGLRLDYPPSSGAASSSRASSAAAAAASPPVPVAVVGAACAAWGGSVLVVGALVLFVLHRRRKPKGGKGSSDRTAGDGSSSEDGLIEEGLEGDAARRPYLD